MFRVAFGIIGAIVALKLVVVIWVLFQLVPALVTFLTK